MTAVMCRSTTAPMVAVLCLEAERGDVVWRHDGVVVRSRWGVERAGYEFSAVSLAEPALAGSDAELMMALHLSGEQLIGGLRADAVRMVELALRGIERVGMSVVREYTQRLHQVVPAERVGTAMSWLDVGAVRWTWRRYQLCTNLTFTLGREVRGGKEVDAASWSLQRAAARGQAR